MKGLMVFGIVFLFIFCSFGVIGSNVQISKIENDCGCNNIIVTGYDTSFQSKNFKYSLGCIEEDLKKIFPNPDVIVGNAPSSFDWRDYEGKNWITPVKDQADCGSCWAFGAIAAMEANYNIINHNPNIDLDLSEQYLVSCGMKKNPLLILGCCGGHLSATLFFLHNYGTVSESMFPYQAVDSRGRNTSDCNNLLKPGSHDKVECKEFDTRFYKIDSFNALANKESIKNALIKYGPVVASFEVFADFFEYEGGIYEQKSNELVGGHIVSIVGYNDSQQCWICKNSWGEDWGENGYFRIKYGECQIDSPNQCLYFKTCSQTISKNIFEFSNIFEKYPLLMKFLSFNFFNF